MKEGEVSFLSSPPTPRLLAPFFARPLLRNRTETLASQASFSEPLRRRTIPAVLSVCDAAYCIFTPKIFSQVSAKSLGSSYQYWTFQDGLHFYV